MDSSSNNNQNTLLMTNVVSSSRSNWNNQKMMETTAQEHQHNNNSSSNSITTTTATFHHDHQQQQIPICSAAGALIWPNNHPLHMIPPPPSYSSSSSSSSFFNEILGGIIQLDEDAEAEEEEEEELGAMKEMMYKIAAMQPVEIDPATIRKPKRRNVRISEDPQSVAARHRRERISERIRILQRLVPGGTKMDTASMLDEAIRYVKFLKRQIRLLQSLPITNTFNHNHNHNINNNCIAPGSDSAYWPPTFASNMLIHGSVAAPPASSMDIPPAGMGFGTISHAHARDDPPTFLHHLRSS